MTEKPLGAKSLDYHTIFTDIFEPIVINNPTEQEEWVKKKIIEALNDDCPKKKVGYLVMEMKDKGGVE